MVIFSNKSGQLGNRLFAFAHLLANALAHDYRLINLSFDEYAKYFQITNGDVFCRYPVTKSFLKSDTLRSWLFLQNRIMLKLMRKLSFKKSFIHSIVEADLPDYQFTSSNYYDLNQKEYQQLCRTNALVFVYGRFFRDYENLEKHQDIIRNYFRPIPSICEAVSKYMILAKQNTDLVIGVHIRRGDYKEFSNGKYFYEMSQYAMKMRELQGGTKNQRIRFVLCSNENLNESELEGIDYKKGPGHFVEDMYALAACDLIMGPPSTYSLWASFYGKKPIYQLKDLMVEVNIASFIHLPSSQLFNFSFN